jgi:threonine synthase
MKLYSTNNRDTEVEFGEAVLRSLPQDNGLYMPTSIPKLPASFIDNLKNKSFVEIAFEVAHLLIGDSLPKDELHRIVEETVNFDAPVIPLHDNFYALELFHGPTLAFKDFGARFMSRVMKYYKDKDEKLYILVATSGDTGGAVASGFLGVDGIEVVILFPKGKVSPLQQKQLTTLGQNITAVEIDGTFDDCQAIVKTAFLDQELNQDFSLSSANSINISRLIPQSFYYFNALRQLENNEDVVFVVPSGNFGNLTAGIIGQQMGMPVKHFVAATNRNDIVPSYLKTGKYVPRPSEATISNAMDVGNPSNFPRLSSLHGSTWNIIKEKIKGYAYSDAQTIQAMKSLHAETGYILDPHGAVGYLAAKQYKEEYQHEGPIVILETAHPSKFIETVEKHLDIKVDIPERLAILSDRKEEYFQQSTDYDTFKHWLKNHFLA